MSLGHGAGVVRSGLVFHYDMSNTQKSWKGAPTTNLFGDAVNYAGLNSYWYLLDNATNYFLLSSSYNSWCMSYGCTLAASTQYTVSFEYKTSLAGTLTIDNDGVDDNTWNATINTTTSWQKYTFTRTQITAGALTLYFRRNSGGDIEVRNVQIEASAFATPFVKGTRSNTQAIADLTGNNTVTATSLTYASDNTFSFNGTSNYIDCGNILSNLTSLTLECWIKFGTQTSSFNGIISKTLNNTNGYELRTTSFTSTTTTVEFRYKGDAAATGSSTLTNGIWYNITATGTLGSQNLYINGSLVSSSTVAVTPDPNALSLVIGKLAYSGLYMNGSLSVARIYNRALSAAEIKQNFEALRGRYSI